MKRKNEMVFPINRKFIEDNLESWDGEYLKLEGGEISDEKFQEISDLIFENIYCFLLRQFSELERRQQKNSEGNTSAEESFRKIIDKTLKDFYVKTIELEKIQTMRF